MRDIEKEVQELFANMSDEEFDDLLNESGFDYEEGNGEVYFNDLNVEAKFYNDSVKIKVKVKSKFNTNNSFYNYNNNGTRFKGASFKAAC
ncbi:hypothetical protein [Luteimonas abyssi]|uniref:hypothetical protein n=1 Tax=Luteimonas abyssi TaxID=1247514 RepID=UPI0012FC4723|nr:hypothetical protein [Luteimonas abyssi]